MISLALKWLARALFALATFSAITALYTYYVLNYGDCADGTSACGKYIATLYAAGIGIVGFSVSGYAAHIISKGFAENDRD